MFSITDSVDYSKIPADLNRIRIYHFPWRQLASFLNSGKEYPHAIAVGMNCLPDGAVIWNVFTKPQAMSFGIVVSHPSFDPVPDGGEPETAILPIEYKIFILVGNDKFACNWEAVGTQDLQAMKTEIDRELVRRRIQRGIVTDG